VSALASEVDERAAAGRGARRLAPRSGLAEWSPARAREDPVAILERQAATRIPELVAVRYGRMLRSPFAFFRGAAAVMAADLAASPSPGLGVQLCGDAHLGNFGTFAGPDRRMIFDLNDFDETLPGPFEWDVRRLVASIEVAGRHRGFPVQARRRALRGAARRYRESVRRLAALRTMDVWYERHEVESLLAEHRRRTNGAGTRSLDRTVAKARAKDSLRALEKLTTVSEGRRRFVHDPPLLVPLRELLEPDEAERAAGLLRDCLRRYRASLPAPQRALIDRFRVADMAHKVVGVGSVGARAWVVLMLGRDERDPLVLQVKEAQPSVLEPHLGASVYRSHGRRVVEGQRLLQAGGDILLGWLTAEGLDGVRRDFYVRQLWDSKGSADLERMPAERFGPYGELCGAALARAHARSGDAVALGAYLGRGDAFDRAMAAFAERYADQNAEDFAALETAADDGRIPAADVAGRRAP
jgi:uncharacterized protein (DUF2252 family)